MEVAIDNVLFLDDLSVCGQLPMVSNHSAKVYVIEQTPKKSVSDFHANAPRRNTVDDFSIHTAKRQ